jgi:hypothetical protein
VETWQLAERDASIHVKCHGGGVGKRGVFFHAVGREGKARMTLARERVDVVLVV